MVRDEPEYKRKVYVPGITLTTPRDLIEIMTHYDIVHTIFPENKLKEATGENFMLGLTCDDEKKIYINNEMSQDLKRLTTIHETLHCHSYINSLGLKESEINKEAYRLFEKMYGHKFASDSIKVVDGMVMMRNNVKK
ncbi:MAG: hypothetical protein Q7S33_01305 [Nanoarchaeota archaeon]|nr:hypothetical protein [Nanoarchaeota archaeon]